MGKKVKKFMIENRLEYLTDVFSKFCRETGMARRKTIRGTL